MTAFRRERLVPATDPEKHGLSQAGSGSDQPDGPVGLGPASRENGQAASRDIGQAQRCRDEIVDEAHVAQAEAPGKKPLIDQPGKLRHASHSRPNRTSDAERRGGGRMLFAREEVREHFLEARVRGAQVAGVFADLEPARADLDKRHGGLGSADVAR